MTPIPMTEERLREIETRLNEGRFRAGDVEHGEVRKLIAALRASRERERELTTALKAWIDHLDGPDDAPTNTFAHEQNLMRRARAALSQGKEQSDG